MIMQEQFLFAQNIMKSSENSNNLDLIRTYLNYIKYVQKRDGKLYNFVGRDKEH